MDRKVSLLHRIRELVQRHFLWLLLAAYALAACWPVAGAAIRGTTLLHLRCFEQDLAISLPLLLLSLLLFNAGLSARVADLRRLLHRPQAVLSGTLANVLVPAAFVLILSAALRWWPNPIEARELIIGLAIVAAMPVAGSSTAWSQHAGGSAALSLGLVVLSTLLSPLTAPLTLAAVRATNAVSLDALRPIAGSGTGMSLFLGVVIPSIAGMLCRRVLGEPRILRLGPRLKLVNALVLLVLCYANASLSLPQVVAAPDWDLLVLLLAAVIALCLSAFAAGWCLAWLLRVGQAQKRSLIFALGMNNNGTGMVLASTSLAALPGAVLPVLAYNLLQHIVAAAVSRTLTRTASPETRLPARLSCSCSRPGPRPTPRRVRGC